MFGKNKVERLEKEEEKKYRENEVSMTKALVVVWTLGITLFVLFFLSAFKVIPAYMTLIISAVILVTFVIVSIIVKKRNQ